MMLGAIHRPAPETVPAMRQRVRLAEVKVPQEVRYYEAMDLGGDDGLPDALGNDVLGNCVPCATLRLMQLWWSNTADRGRRPRRHEAEALYTRFAGYDPENPGTDVGTFTDDAYSKFSRNGYLWADQLHVAPRWVTVKTENEAFDATEAKFAIDRFGGMLATFEMPRSAVEDMFVWGDPPPNTPDAMIVGAHEVVIAGYDSHWWYGVSWGRLIRISYPFMLRRNIASNAFVSNNAWLQPSGRTIAGLDFDQLRADAETLRGM